MAENNLSTDYILQTFEQPDDQGGNIHDDPVYARLIWMHHIRLIKYWVLRHAFQKEWIQGKFVFFRKPGINCVERGRILVSQIAHCLHPRQQDRNLAVLETPHHDFKIGVSLFGGQAPQPVIGAKLKDHRICAGADRPVEPRKSIQRGVAGHAGIFHLHRDAKRRQMPLQFLRKRILRRQPVSGGQTVAHHNQHRRLFRQRRTGGKHQHQKEITKWAIDPESYNPMFRHVHHAAAGARLKNPIIHFDKVHLSLNSSAGMVDILRGVDLSVHEGEAVGLIGPSGSGKSTMLMVMAGLERASSGIVRVAGHDLGSMTEDQLAAFRRHHTGIVFQSFHLIATMTALENVAVPLELAGRRDAFARAGEALESTGLANRMGHYPGQLSGGEQQRVALARAVAAKPRILLADEPTGNLDGATGEQIIQLMFALQSSTGATLLLITHDASLAAQCGRVVHLLDGKIARVTEGAASRAAAGN